MPRYNDGTKVEMPALLKAAAYEIGPDAVALALWSKGHWCEDHAHDGPIALHAHVDCCQFRVYVLVFKMPADFRPNRRTGVFAAASGYPVQ